MLSIIYILDIYNVISKTTIVEEVFFLDTLYICSYIKHTWIVCDDHKQKFIPQKTKSWFSFFGKYLYAHSYQVHS
jgi:hypothetical protein